MSRVVVLVNDLLTMKPEQSTVALARGLMERGHSVGITEVTGIDVEPDGRLFARAHTSKATDATRWVQALRTSKARRVPLDDVDCVLVRLSPGRDERTGQQSLALQLLQQHVLSGGLVLNNPTGLFAASTKLYITRFPDWTRPDTLVSSSAAQLRAFVAGRDELTVLKPVNGTQGRDVFFVDDDGERNLSAIISNLLRQGPVMAQAFLPEATEGDVRVLLLDGNPIEVDGAFGVVRRRPARGELRSNVHLGGNAEHAEFTPTLRRIVEAVGPVLRRDGLFLVGLDVVGDAIVECNVFAPGGFTDVSAFTDRDFVTPVLEAIEARIEAR